jgi:membrane-associated phospholipid phosphatase
MGIYTGVNYAVAETAPTRVLPTMIDTAVPFCAEAMLIYGGIYALALSPLCLLADRRMLLRGALAYVVLLGSALPFWVFWPVTVPREPVPVHDLWTWAVAFMRYVDPPANCFPSMHVGETVLAALMCWRMDRTTGVLVGVLAALVWWSTLALDQHWFVDGLFGAVLAIVADAVAFRWRPLPRAAFARQSRKHLLWAAGLFVLQFVTVAIPWWFDIATPIRPGGD